MGGIHLFLPRLDPGDASSTHTLNSRQVAREMGFESQIFVESAHPSLVRETRPFTDYRGEPGDVLVYQLAVGSVVADFLRDRGGRLVVDYHNITPASFFEVWEPALAHGALWGRRQLQELSGRTEVAVADSSFNEAELVEAGYGRTAVVPILLDTSTFDVDVDEPALERLVAAKEDGGADWLFVGRVVPNKAQHDVVKAFAAYRRLHDDRARLHLVGASSSPAYSSALAAYVAALGLEGAVHLPGSVSHGVLAAHFRAADVFVCLSDHEGFCVPIVEAMHHELPVVAFAAGAVPETVGEAGIVLDDKSPALVAAAVQRVLRDDGLRASLVGAGSRRVADFGLDRTSARLREVLGEIVGS